MTTALDHSQTNGTHAPKDPKATPFQWRDGSTTGATLNPPPSAA